MLDMKFTNEMAKRLSESVPPGLNKFKKDLEKNFHVVLKNVFSKLELVTREEFNVQKGVLSKTREKLSILTKQVAEMEKYLPKLKVKNKTKMRAK